MLQFPEKIKFKYTWREYQQRVLDDLETHLLDDHLHIVAPPGSGKTVLGLEVALRINKPCLILAPTIAIRNQWIQRFCELFLQTEKIPDWISRDIRHPSFMTVATYQGVHAACNHRERTSEDKNLKIYKAKFENLPAIIKGLKAQNVQVLVVDEAHHLKNEWWQTLDKIKQALQPTIVGLTATPPFDVSPNEWNRYITLNGPVDTEISVPELVDVGDLCPHQDLVYYTAPTRSEQDALKEFRENVDAIIQELLLDEQLLLAIQTHKYWQNPDQHLDWIYGNLEYYSACMIFLNYKEIEISEANMRVITDEEHIDIPPMNPHWLRILLDFYLFIGKGDFGENYTEHQTKIENRLRRYGATTSNRVSFTYNERLSNSLTSSISKLDAVTKIADYEYQQLGNKLRMVILSDFIRREYFVHTTENNVELAKLGVIPIFEKLRRENSNNKKLGVLTGTLVIIPQETLTTLISKAARSGIEHLSHRLVPYDHNYVLIPQDEQLKHHLVHLVTELFQSGEIEILVGTKSLLGEGWDAPNINALVLASFVGSFVSSNQMRGRAIRTQRGNEDKTSHIWHIACIDPTAAKGGDDLALLHRRFKSFVGLSMHEHPTIRNGLNRLYPPTDLFDTEAIENKNSEMLAFAQNRHTLKLRWQQALTKGTFLVEEIKVPFLPKEDMAYQQTQKFYLNKSIRYLATTSILAITAFFETAFGILGRTSRLLQSAQQVRFVFYFILFAGLVYYGRKGLKALLLHYKYRDIAKDIHQIGQAVLNTLLRSGMIHSESGKLKVLSYSDEEGAVYCHLEGGTAYDKSVFIQHLEEIIRPIDNPRYVIIRHSSFLNFRKQKDYHAVPESFGRSRQLADYFAHQWEFLVGSCTLVYTRSYDGRKLLLKSRWNSLSAKLSPTTEHVSQWR